jgi:type VI secretion system protein ImpE
VHLHLEALDALRAGNFVEALEFLEASVASRLPLKGRLDEQPFADFRDGDDLFAPVLEMFVHTSYVWLPFEQIKRLNISAPRRLRDLLWIPAALESHHGPVGDVFLPVLYGGSSEHVDEQVKLGRMTDWRTVTEGMTLGVGQHLFCIDGQDRGMLEVRSLEFEVASVPGSAL